MNWSVDFDKDIMKGKALKQALKASPWLKKIKRAEFPISRDYKYGIAIGALQGLKHQVDPEIAARIKSILEICGEEP